MNFIYLKSLILLMTESDNLPFSFNKMLMENPKSATIIIP